MIPQSHLQPHTLLPLLNDWLPPGFEGTRRPHPRLCVSKHSSFGFSAQELVLFSSSLNLWEHCALEISKAPDRHSAGRLEWRYPAISQRLTRHYSKQCCETHLLGRSRTLARGLSSHQPPGAHQSSSGFWPPRRICAKRRMPDTKLAECWLHGENFTTSTSLTSAWVEGGR